MTVEISDNTSNEMSDFIKANWNALRTMAKAANPDEVLVTWMRQKHFVCHTKLRQALIDEDPEAAPPEAKAGPLALEEGAENTKWVVICTPDSEGGFQIAWLTLSFFPEAQA
jgi:hypothetical protein